MWFYQALRNPRGFAFKESYAIILFLWFCAMGFASTKGVRFSLFLIIPLGIGLCAIITEACQFFKEKSLLISRAIILGISILGIFYAHTALSNAPKISPLINNDIYTTLVSIKEKTPENAIINTWWDFGDWIETIAKRKVVFDGQTQDVPQAYWMARILLSTDEKEALEILRMLDNGGNRAFELLAEHTKDPFSAMTILMQLLKTEPTQIPQALAKLLPGYQNKELIEILSKEPPCAYFMVDNSMPAKMLRISFSRQQRFHQSLPCPT